MTDKRPTNEELAGLMELTKKANAGIEALPTPKGVQECRAMPTNNDIQGVIDALDHPAGINAAGKQVVRSALMELQQYRADDAGFAGMVEDYETKLAELRAVVDQRNGECVQLHGRLSAYRKAASEPVGAPDAWLWKKSTGYLTAGINRPVYEPQHSAAIPLYAVPPIGLLEK